MNSIYISQWSINGLQEIYKEKTTSHDIVYCKWNTRLWTETSANSGYIPLLPLYLFWMIRWGVCLLFADLWNLKNNHVSYRKEGPVCLTGLIACQYTLIRLPTVYIDRAERTGSATLLRYWRNVEWRIISWQCERGVLKRARENIPSTVLWISVWTQFWKFGRRRLLIYTRRVVEGATNLWHLWELLFSISTQ